MRHLIKEETLKTVFNKLIDRVDSQLAKIGADTPEERNVLILLFVAILFSAVCHVLQIIFFVYLGSLTLAVVNFFSICIYAVCTVLLMKRKAGIAGILFSSEIAVVGVIITYMIGTSTFIFAYSFVVLLIQMIIPYAGWKIRIPIIFGIFVLMLTSFFIGNTLLPSVDITPIKTAYSIFNLLIGSTSAIAIIAVSNTVHKIILQLNKTKLEKYMDEAHLDALTGLYNRRYAAIIFEEIRNDIDQRDAWCVAMLDIDDFKQINDRHGHDFGDVVLQKLAETIKASLRKTDYVFRWGGEEFLILLRAFDINDAYLTLEKICAITRKNEMFDGENKVCVSVTIGLSKCYEGNIEKSISVSDQKLYKGKRAGKNIVVM